jgi:hypothetical protein
MYWNLFIFILNNFLKNLNKQPDKLLVSLKFIIHKLIISKKKLKI